MSLLILRLIDSELIIKGRDNCTINKDPYLTLKGNIEYSLSAGWFFDGKTLKVFSDRLGMIPIFYWQGHNEIYISDCLRDIVTNIPNPIFDYDALSVFLRIGFYIGNDTPVSDVKVLPPNNRITITANNFHFKTTSLEISSKHESFNHSEAIEMYTDLFHEAVSERMLPGKFALPLSGGRDSRHILLECLNIKRPPDLVITSKKSNITGQDEIDVASLLCKEYALNHLITEYDSKGIFSDEIIKNELTHYLSDEHAWYLSVVEILKEENIDLLLDGIGGDVLSNGLFYKPILYDHVNNYNSYAATEIIIGTKSELSYLSDPLKKELNWQRASTKISNELEKHYDSPDPIKSFYFWNRTRREISLSPLYMLSQTVNVSLPYLTPKLLNLFFSLPSKSFGKPGFHDEVITHHTTKCSVRYEDKDKYNNSIVRFGGEWSSSLKYLLNTPPPPYIDKAYVLPRIIRLISTGNYSKESWFLKRLLYINELHRLGISAT